MVRPLGQGLEEGVEGGLDGLAEEPDDNEQGCGDEGQQDAVLDGYGSPLVALGEPSTQAAISTDVPTSGADRVEWVDEFGQPPTGGYNGVRASHVTHIGRLALVL